MAVFIPAKWKSSDNLDLHRYATKTELLNYLQKDTDGHVDMQTKKVVNVGDPADSGDVANKEYCDEKLSKAGGAMTGDLDMGNRRIANIGEPTDPKDVVSKGYLQRLLPKPIICITAEATGQLVINESSFSFGANSSKYVRSHGGHSVGNRFNGVVMPVSGGIKYFTVCTTNSTGNAPPHSGLNFAIIINGDAIMNADKIVSIPSRERTGSKTFVTSHPIEAGDRINFLCGSNGPLSFMTVASVFIELDV